MSIVVSSVTDQLRLGTNLNGNYICHDSTKAGVQHLSVEQL